MAAFKAVKDETVKAKKAQQKGAVSAPYLKTNANQPNNQ